MAETNLYYGEMLGICSDDTHYKKRTVNVKDIDTINQHLADNRESHAGKDEKPVTAETVELHVDEKYHPTIRKMLKKHESLWSGELGKIVVQRNLTHL